MLVLDTDHFSELVRGSPAGRRLTARLEASDQDKVLSVVTVEETLRGWLAQISRYHDPRQQLMPYAKFHRQIELFGDWIVLPWNAESAELFLRLRENGIRIGTMDLKIASAALSHDATLLTRNTTDFAQVPKLRFENWLD